MTSVVFLWEEPDGKRCWEAVKEEQYTGFLVQLLNRGVHPATVMVAYAPILFRWVWKKFHKGLSDVCFLKINEEIYGTEPAPENAHKPVDVPVEQKPETKFGWIAPDGRFFGCGYGGHTSEARRMSERFGTYATRSATLKILGGQRYSKAWMQENATVSAWERGKS